MNTQLFFTACYIGLFAAYIPKCRGDCNPTEGTETTISCGEYGSTRSPVGLFWRAEVEGKVMTVATCPAPGVCYSNDEDIFEASFENGNSYSSLTIKSASRTHPFNMATRWFCTFLKDGHYYNITACSQMMVMEKAKSPTCGPMTMTLNDTDWQISLTCWTERVYPEAICQLYSGHEYDIRKITQYCDLFEPRIYDHTEMNETLVYYKTECSFLLPLDILKDYHGTFYRVAMYPGPTYTDIKKIKLAVIEEGIDDAYDYDDNDDDKVSFPVIALAVALGVALVAVEVLAIVICRYRQTKVKRPEMLMWSTQTTDTSIDMTSGRPAMARDSYQPRRSTTVSSTESTSPGKMCDNVNETVENKGYVEED